MATAEHKGGKVRKRPLRLPPITPYNRPLSAVRGVNAPQLENAAGGSRWISNLVDPAARVVFNSASRLFSSVMRKGLTAPPGQNISTIEKIPGVKSSPEVREKIDNPIDVMPSMLNDECDNSKQGLISHSDDISDLEQLIKRRSFSRAETERLTKLLQLPDEPSTLTLADFKKKGKMDADSNIKPSFSLQVVNYEENIKANASAMEGQREQLVNLHLNATSGVIANHPEEGFVSPIQIARAYMSSKRSKAGPSSLGLESQMCHEENISPSNFPLGNRLSNAAISSRFAMRFPMIPTEPGNCRTPKLFGRSALHKFPRSQNCRPFKMTNSKEYSPCNDRSPEPTRSIELASPLPNIRHSGHGKALKRGSADSGAGFFVDARRVRQKSCLKDSGIPICGDTLSTFSTGLEFKQNTDLKSLENLDDRIPSASVLHVPPQSIEMAKKILHHLDNIKPSPRSKLVENKVNAGETSLSKISISPFSGSSLKCKGNGDSINSVYAQGSRILENSNSSNLTRIAGILSPNKDSTNEEASQLPSISGAEVAFPCSAMKSIVTPVLDVNDSVRSMDFNSHGLGSLSRNKELTVQASVEEQRKKFSHSLGARASSTLPKAISSIVTTTTLANEAAPNEENSVSSFKFGSINSSDNVTNVQTGETIVDRPTSKLDKGASSTILESNSASSSSAFSTSVSPTFQFGSGNSNFFSFTGFPSISLNSAGTIEPKFQFGSSNSSSNSFSGLSTICSNSSTGSSSSSTPAFSSAYPIIKGSDCLPTSSIFSIPTNRVFGTSSCSTSGGSNSQFSDTSAPQFGLLGTPAAFGLSSSPQASLGSVVHLKDHPSSNDQTAAMDNSRTGSNLKLADPMATTLGQPTSSLQLDPSIVFQNNAAPQNPSQLLGFSAGNGFSLGSGGSEQSQRKFIRVRRDNKLRKK